MFGFYIGKWIYIIDAIDDYKSDKKKKEFNPFNEFDEDTAKSVAEKILIDCEERLDQIAALLPYNNDSGIISNIIQKGMPKTRTTIFNGEKLLKI